MVSRVSGVSASRATDVVVIGDGLIGLSTALELGRAGASCVVLGTPQPGAASAAAAGLLVPWGTALPEPARAFFDWGLSLYAGFVAGLQPYDDTLRIIKGLVERTGAEDTLHETLHEQGGAIDNVRLLAAVRRAVASHSLISTVPAMATAVEAQSGGVRVTTSDGHTQLAAHVVVAAGAWAAQIAGLPRPLPVRPLKGQMIALGAALLSRPVMGDNVYLVPRGNETLVGATVEEKGFDLTVTDDAVQELREGAARLYPALRDATLARSWAGSRPASPDMLPILGPDPALPSLLYACGHSKNGILLAPATARVIADWCAGKPTPAIVAPFSIGRFVHN